MQHIETSQGRVYFLNKYTTGKSREEILERLLNIKFPRDLIEFYINDKRELGK